MGEGHFYFLANALGYGVSSSIANGVLTANIVTKAVLNISAASCLKNALGRVQIRLLKSLKLEDSA